LLGEAVTGLLITDRWGTYNRLGVYRRQLCWAHVKREFQRLVDRGGPGQALGEELLTFTADVFHWWYRVRDGTLSQASLRTYIEEQRPRLRDLLARGRVCGCAKAAALCAGLWEWEPALWAFVRAEVVEPTNNAAELALRPAVLWRSRSQGSRSEAGCRFVERMLTAVQTLRVRQRNVLAYLQEAITAHRAKLPAPQLLPTG
jgi:transposase